MLNVVSKGEFAKLVGMSPGRVSQLIADGRLADCLVGEGFKAKIDADKAREKLKIRLDAAQRLGNGAATQLGPADDLDLKLKQAKLEEAETRNRRLREEEMARRGLYVLAEDAKVEGARLASVMLQLFEGGMTDIANAVAAEFKLPARDVQHLIKGRFRDLRTAVSSRLATDAANLADSEQTVDA